MWTGAQNTGQYDLPYTIFYDSGKEFSGKITLEVKGDTLIEIRNVQVNSNNTAVEPGEVFKIAVSFENVEITVSNGSSLYLIRGTNR